MKLIYDPGPDCLRIKGWDFLKFNFMEDELGLDVNRRKSYVGVSSEGEGVAYLLTYPCLEWDKDVITIMAWDKNKQLSK